MPKRLSWSSRLISNCSIGLCIIVPSSPTPRRTSGQATLSVAPPAACPRVRPNGAPGIVGAGDETPQRRPVTKSIRRPTQPAVEPIAEKAPDQKARDHIHQHSIGNACLAVRHSAYPASARPAVPARFLQPRIQLVDPSPGAIGIRIGPAFCEGVSIAYASERRCFICLCRPMRGRMSKGLAEILSR